MVLNIEVTLVEWKPSAIDLSNRTFFNGFLTKLLSNYFKNYESIERVYLRLPSSVTKSERYLLHKMTINGNFHPRSFDDMDQDRIMEIEISKKYLQELFKDYPFHELTEVIVQTPVTKTEKQLLFESLLAFIERELPSEFKNYLDSL